MPAALCFPSGQSDQKAAIGVGCNVPRDPGRVKVQGEAATAHKKTEITIQTDQFVLVRRRGYTRRWCPECGSDVDVVDLVQSEALPGKARPRLRESAAAKKWHYLEAPDGTPLVCLESLLKSM